MEIYIDELSKEYPQELDQQFSFQETIASGAFGTVYRAIETATNREVAIKVINKSGAKLALLQKLKQEVCILKQLKHENIVEFFGYIETNTKLYIMMELIKCGTLKNWIQTHKGTITEEEASTIINHLLSAVCYLHSRDICHRDIKPENVMLNNFNDLTTLKLIDFGLSQQHFDYLEENDYCGTMLYMAPEQIEKKTYTKTVDIWAIGIIMFMLLNNGKHPFYNKGDRRRSYVSKIKKTKVKLFNKCSQMASVLLFKLVEPNPSWRYTAEKAYRHPWITRCIEDEVPETFNETLKKLNVKKRFKELMAISIFLNKAAIESCNSKTFLINSAYVNKANDYNKRQRDKIIRLREKSFDVISSESSIDDLNDLPNKPVETFRPPNINNNCINVDLIKVKQNKSISISTKFILHKNTPSKNIINPNKFNTHHKTNKIITKSNNNNYYNVGLPIIPKSTFQKISNDSKSKNAPVLPIKINQAKSLKDSYMNYVPSNTKVVTVPKIKNTNARASLICNHENVSPSFSSIQVSKTEPNPKQFCSNPTRNIGKSTELREKILNKFVLSSSSPRKGINILLMLFLYQ